MGFEHEYYCKLGSASSIERSILLGFDYYWSSYYFQTELFCSYSRAEFSLIQGSRQNDFKQEQRRRANFGVTTK